MKAMKRVILLWSAVCLMPSFANAGACIDGPILNCDRGADHPLGGCRSDWVFGVQNTPKQPPDRHLNAAYICGFNEIEKAVRAGLVDHSRQVTADLLIEMIGLCDIASKNQLTGEQLGAQIIDAIRNYPLADRIKPGEIPRLCHGGRFDPEREYNPRRR